MLSHRAHENVDMLHGPIALAIVRFAVPIILANLLQLAFHAADIIVLGQFAGDDAVAAVTSTSYLIGLLVNFTTGLSLGANVAAARAIGEGDRDKTGRVVHTSMALALICGIVLLAVGIGAARTLLLWTNTPEAVLPMSTLYLRIYFLGAPASMICNFGANLLRAGGDTRRPMYYLSAAGALNVVLNLFFVVVLHMGVAGVAWAPAIAQWLSGGLVLRALLRENGPLRFRFRQLGLDGRVVGQLLHIGLPASMQGVLIALSKTVIQSSVNTLGKQFMAGSGAVANMESFVWAALNSFTQACVTFTSQNLGARQLERIDRVRRWSLVYAVGVSLVMSLAMYAFARPLLSIYISGEEATQAGLLRMQYALLPIAILGIQDVLVGCQRGLGKSIPPMIVSLMGLCVFRIVWVLTVFRSHPTAFVLLVSFPISWVLT